MKYLPIPIVLATLVLALPIRFLLADSQDPILKRAADQCAQFESEVQDMHMVQEMKTLATDQPITVEQTVYTKGTKTRVEMKMPLPLDSAGGEPQTMQTIMINDGSNAWIFSPLGEKKQLSPEEAKQYEPSRNCWGFFPDNARVIGSDSAQGRDCYIVELEDEGVLTRLWLDKSDFIPVQGQTHDSTGAMQYHWVHSDFHKIRGQWEYPYMTKMYNGDTLTVQMSVTSLEVNQGLSDERQFAIT